LNDPGDQAFGGGDAGVVERFHEGVAGGTTVSLEFADVLALHPLAVIRSASTCVDDEHAESGFSVMTRLRDWLGSRISGAG